MKYGLSDDEKHRIEKYLKVNLQDPDKLEYKEKERFKSIKSEIINEIKPKINIKNICSRLIEKIQEYQDHVIEDQFME